MNRKELKKIAKELLECNEDTETMQSYSMALRFKNIEQITFFKSMGDCVRQQLMNVHEYIEGLRFGFTSIKFDENGWLDNHVWESEEVEVPACKKHDKYFKGNHIRLAKGLNGNWAYGVNYSLGGGAGGGWMPNVYMGAYKLRDEAYRAGIGYLLEKHQYALTQNDSSNYCHDCNRKVITWISENVKTENTVEQLKLF